MKAIFNLSIIILAFITFASCDSSADRSAQKDSIPAALQDDHSDVSFISKRGGENLVDEIYGDLQKKQPELKKLEEAMDANREMQVDSLKPFNSYKEKSDEYYSSAISYVDDIKDSLLRKEIKKLINDNKAAYENKIFAQTKLLADIDKAGHTLNDSHILLKLFVTLPIIAQYQNKQAPDNKKLQPILAAKQKLIDRTKALTPKR